MNKFDFYLASATEEGLLENEATIFQQITAKGEELAANYNGVVQFNNGETTEEEYQQVLAERVSLGNEKAQLEDSLVSLLEERLGSNN